MTTREELESEIARMDARLMAIDRDAKSRDRRWSHRTETMAYAVLFPAAAVAGWTHKAWVGVIGVLLFLSTWVMERLAYSGSTRRVSDEYARTLPRRGEIERALKEIP